MKIKNKDEISLQWLFKQSSPDRWNLNDANLASFLGVNEELIEKYRGYIEQGKRIELTNDTSTRLSTLLGIHKAIYEISPHGQEYLFFTNPNSGDFFKGLSIKEFLIKEATTGALAKVKAWLSSNI
jgi:hypothetical protein